MKRFLSVLLVLCGLGTTLASYAEKADATKPTNVEANKMEYDDLKQINTFTGNVCLLYTSPSPRDKRQSRMPSSA